MGDQDLGFIYIGTTEGISTISKLIRWFQWGEKETHVFYVCKNTNSGYYNDLVDPTVIETNPFQNMVKIKLKENHTPGTKFNIYQIRTTKEKALAVEKDMEKLLGTKYDFTGVVGFATRSNDTNSKDRLFCSESLMTVFKKHNIGLLEFMEPHQVQPYLMVKPEMVEKIYEGVI